ncbi:hypothetical protein [Prevotella sp. E13-27]|uniref:hypothetical protein n=1 Tax=Prevotella sp. E13-27 TaxID=2938122 RepID=UPI00200B09FB|nr:hypothetical protein [Prevotella sp. E13-27]MCK8621051.1 hypothetical protein [Prevotella sp. E13-27]
MNKLVVIALFVYFGSCHLVNAQEYKIDNIRGKVEVKEVKKDDSGQWKRIFNDTKVNGLDLIKVDKRLNLYKNGSKKYVYKIKTPKSVNDVWILGKIRPNPMKYKSPEISHLGGGEKDSIGFYFITTEGENRLDSIIHQSDTLEAFVLSHNLNDTLYAYAFWIFSNETDPLHKEAHREVLNLLPETLNEFFFEEDITITTKVEKTKMVIFYTKTKSNVPNSLSDNYESICDELKRNGWNYVEFEIVIQQ